MLFYILVYPSSAKLITLTLWETTAYNAKTWHSYR